MDTNHIELITEKKCALCDCYLWDANFPLMLNNDAFVCLPCARIEIEKILLSRVNHET